MPTYVYEARDPNGEAAAGSIAATSPSEAAQLLRAEGRFIVRLSQAAADEHADAATPRRNTGARVRPDDVIYFAHQMAIMIETGVPLSEALESAVQQASSEQFREVLEDVSEAIQNGSSFSAALAAHPRAFPNLMISLIHASEASGTMGQMLERISKHLSKQRRTAKKIRGAMVYPLFMFTAAVSVTAFLLLFVLPRFAGIYEGRGAALPMPTQVLISLSDLAITYWYAWVGAAAAVTAAWFWFRSIPIGRRYVDHLKIQLPVLGPMFRQLYITRAMQTMGTLIRAGVPMLEMVRITRNITGNTHYQELWDQVADKLRDGAQLSDPLTDSPLIPQPIARMVHAGEKAGRLSDVMDRIAEFTEADFDEAVARATSFVEPVMVGAMGLMIGGVAISLLLPIFSIGRVVSQ